MELALLIGVAAADYMAGRVFIHAIAQRLELEFSAIGEREEVVSDNNKSIQVPAFAYQNIGERALRLQQELQALWDACYLTHPDKERLTRAYIKRLDDLRGGASPITMDVSQCLDAIDGAASTSEGGVK